jgi:predicted small secreted protein
MKKLTALTLVIFSLAACNTLNGMGKDIEKAGEKIQSSTK